METFIRDIRQMNLDGRKLFIRVDFDVPVDKRNGAILDDTKIRAAIPTLQLAQKKGARIILGSHLGRPEGRPEPRLSLVGVGSRLAELLDAEVLLPDAAVGDGPRSLVHNLREGQVLLLENLRFHPEEAADDDGFARQLAGLCDAYVGDAFAVAHEKHASVHALPRLVKERGAGLLLTKELEALEAHLKEPPRPFVVVLGGAPQADRIGAVEGLLSRCDMLLLGGALAHTFLAARGESLGKTKVEQDKISIARRALTRAEARKVALHLPHDHIVGDGSVVVNEGFPAEAQAIDIGPATVEYFTAQIGHARSVFWSGPMGVVESAAGARGTQLVAEAVARHEGVHVAAGGDTAAVLAKLGLDAKLTHLASGGAAALAWLDGKDLPGVEALRVPRPEL